MDEMVEAGLYTASIHSQEEFMILVLVVYHGRT